MLGRTTARMLCGAFAAVTKSRWRNPPKGIQRVDPHSAAGRSPHGRRLALRLRLTPDVLLSCESRWKADYADCPAVGILEAACSPLHFHPTTSAFWRQLFQRRP